MLADLSINYVERQILLCGFSAQRVERDYGYDLIVTTFSQGGQIEPGFIFLQVKGTNRLPRLASGRAIPWYVTRRDLNLWLDEAYPVILIVYDGRKENAYWLQVQTYILESRVPQLFAGGETISIHVPVENRLARSAIRAMARMKNRLHKRIRRGGHEHA